MEYELTMKEQKKLYEFGELLQDYLDGKFCDEDCYGCCSDEEGSHIDCHCFRALKRFKEALKEFKEEE